MKAQNRKQGYQKLIQGYFLFCVSNSLVHTAGPF